MKFTALEKTFYDNIGKVKSATSSSRLVERMLLLVLEGDILTITCSAGNIFAQCEIGVKGEEDGAVVMPLDSFEVFQYSDDNACTFELKRVNLHVDGDTIRKGKLRIHSTEREHYTVPEFPDEMVQVGKEVFDILYPIDDRNLTLNAVFAWGDLFATGNQRAFAGFKNEEGVCAEPIAISPTIFSAIKRGEFTMGVKGHMVFFKQTNLIVAMPLLATVNDYVFNYAWLVAEPIAWVEVAISGMEKLINITHELSKGRFEGADGRGTLLVRDNMVYAIPSGNDVGEGETTPIQPVNSEGEILFGFSTKMFKEAITHVDNDHRIARIELCEVGGPTVFIIKGTKTRHFMAEDPNARAYAEKAKQE